MVVRAGLEPATTCLEGRCSIQLSYRTAYALTAYNITSFGSFFKAFPAFRRIRDGGFFTMGLEKILFATYIHNL